MAPSFLDTAAQGMGNNSLADRMPIQDKKDAKIPMVLLVDTSGSMEGDGIDGVNQGIENYTQEVLKNENLSRMVEIAIVSFNNNVEIIHPFSSIKDFTPTQLTADGLTVMGNGILTAIDLVYSRKEKYKAEGVDYFRPWIFMITDGAATDMGFADSEESQNVELLNQVISAVHDGEDGKHFEFYPVAVGNAVDMKQLKAIASHYPPVHLKRNKWNEMFSWIHESQVMKSKSKPGDTTKHVDMNPWVETH